MQPPERDYFTRPIITDAAPVPVKPASVETMLTEQVHALHRLFGDALDKCAQSQNLDRSRVFGAIALKAQSSCRQTVAVLKTLCEKQDMPRELIEGDRSHLQTDNAAVAPGDVLPVVNEAPSAPMAQS